jgi:hypothetical protein
MPNIWTHLIFGKELLEKLQHEAMLRDTQLKHVFNLGCQGPDFLFYHNFWPWNRDKTMPQLGSGMHAKECGPFLLSLLKHVQGRGLYNPAVIYMLGFISHHILDRNMHPYIFYKSGFKKWHHQRFEIIMDTLIVRKKLGLETWSTPVWKEIYVGEQFPLGIVNALLEASTACYPTLTKTVSAKDWDDAYRDMIKAQKLFHDPKGIKRVLTLSQIEPLVYKRKLVPLDYLNEQHLAWHCPTSREETYTTSVWDMWDLALEDGFNVLQEAIAILQEGKSVENTDYSTFEKFLGDRSYETGKPCSSGLEITYVNPMI